MLPLPDLSEYIPNFDTLTYPPQLYQDLVVDGLDSAHKMALMGAWKTGAIRVPKNNQYGSLTTAPYIDSQGNRYVFTHRWQAGAPVGYSTWMSINAHPERYRQRIPARFTMEQPAIVTELVARPGFGFIWALFFLHCYYPQEYPLYDQHVYRAYKYHESAGQQISGYASKTWEEYAKYRAFFRERVATTGRPFWEVDRGFWALGKALKGKRLTQPGVDRTSVDLTPAIDTATAESVQEEESWLHSLTLGGKAKRFHWKLDKASNLHLLRQFKSSGATYGPWSRLTNEAITQLAQFVVQKRVVWLSNNVAKLHKGTEKEGIGRFMHETLKLSVAEAQLASQVAALFVEAGIWQWNGQQRNMSFEVNLVDWQTSLRAYYNRQLNLIDE